MMTYMVGWRGITLIAGIIVLLDYLGERKQRKARRPAGPSSSPHADDFWP
jgi:hypothetical protein